ncbi:MULTISPECIES: hypothetical protein [unclassified Aeromicrobium]|uniref:hypothetical protein n=1 Tax=unclassified Aeromicrobium TaxID=2633570 RepID=UPI0006FD7D66|nr:MULTISPECIES: hypothetical protein [unclassified Aeromicrobium]KQO37390.1 hypothetical protein ASF05_06240 [Aeromicrobium sp. Leaf245]KQP75914.1 hypothetical protein ASF37_13230 [Aeromicrobium sp. Leaf289]
MTAWFAALVTWWGTLLGPGDTAEECLLLGRLDAERAHAFVHADVDRLAAVYASDGLRERDVEVLEDYAERSLRLEGMAQLRSSCRVVERDADRVALDVVDRLGPTRAVNAGGAVPLPTDEPTRRRVTLEETASGWRVVASR